MSANDLKRPDAMSGKRTIDSIHSHGISFSEALRVWLRISLLSFGGPAGQIAVMHRIVVEEKTGSLKRVSCMR